MTGNIVKIETAMIGRLPQAKGEIWEVGRRRLDLSIAEMERKGQRPEALLAVQVSGRGGAILANVIASDAPSATLADFIVQAMRQPLMGKPRRPQVVRVGFQPEADALSATLSTVGVRLEVATALATLDGLLAEMGSMLGGVGGDYRTQAAQAGEPLGGEGMLALFGAAKAFHRAALWEDFGDEVMFEVEVQPAHGRASTLYGIVLGNMGEEFGLALYPSLADFQRFYELSVQRLDQLMEPPVAAGKRRTPRKQRQQADEMMTQVLSIPALSLSYTPQRDVPPPLVQEATQLRLPLANKSAFPLVMRMGDGRMSIGSAKDLRDVYVGTRAILDWDRRISAMEVDDEVGVTITTKLPSIANFLPALTVHTTLRLNPYAPEEETALPGELDEVLQALFDVHSAQAEAARTKSAKSSGGKTSKAGVKKTPPDAGPKSPRLYTLKVYLTGGPVTEGYGGRETSRTIEILGHHTLHDLHQVIFKAFGRFEEHFYEFNLGKGSGDRVKLYRYHGGWDGKSTKARNPETTSLDSLKLQAERRFGYTFDMGDNWEHVIDVVAVAQAPTKGKFPRVTIKVGAAPPQYADEDA
jgi:hypothetical protein